MLKSTTRAVCFIILFLHLCNEINSQRCCIDNTNQQWQPTNEAKISQTRNQQSSDRQTQPNFDPNSDINRNQHTMQINVPKRIGSPDRIRDRISHQQLNLPTPTGSHKRTQVDGDFINRDQLNQYTQPSHNEPSNSNYNIPDTNENQKQNSVTDFSLNLLKAITTDKNQNLIVSPISVQFLLLLLKKGAGEGPTKTELKDKIGSSTGQALLNILKPKENGLKTALGIFHDKTINIKQQYKDEVNSLAVIQSYDFVGAPSPTKQKINNWASQNTEGKITNLISDNYNLQSVNFVLLSAIYFHNTWKYKFEPISNQKFNFANGKSKPVPFMEFTQNIPFYEIPEYKCTVINLPYENEKYSMVLIIPNENSQEAGYNTETNPLDQFIQNFDSTKLHEILSTTKQKFERFIKLQIPKFSVKSEFTLVEPLKQIGITKIFGSDSDLSKITTSNMYVSDILQQATLDVDENGTIAAAATSALLIPLSAGSRPKPTTFTLNRPFIAIILDQDNSTPLFISKINNPVL